MNSIINKMLAQSGNYPGNQHISELHNYAINIWVRSRNCGCLVTWFCYQLIAKPGNKTATFPWPDPYLVVWQATWLTISLCPPANRAGIILGMGSVNEITLPCNNFSHWISPIPAYPECSLQRGNIKLDDVNLQVLTLTSKLILGLRPANERRHYKVTPSLIGWAQTQNQPCDITESLTNHINVRLIFIDINATQIFQFLFA